ncbi:hypothetical protein TNCV_1678261 [Trichonephila clavipes]|nr:hypothetical protein TNCV_1678261 [Trichonephila clavipes]
MVHARFSCFSKYPGYHLLRRQSSQPGPRQSRQGLRKQDFSYGFRGRSLGGPPRPIHLPRYVESNALHTSALKCAGAPSCWN